MEEAREDQPCRASSQAVLLGVCPEDEINLRDLWCVLLRQWKVSSGR
jgi:hypothetical protein